MSAEPQPPPALSPASVNRGPWLVWLLQCLPIEALVPKVYAAWRPLVGEAFAYVAAHLSAARWQAKLEEQLALPADATPQQRLVQLLARMPALQKIAQVLARDPNLDAALRRELAQLEDAVADTTPAEIHACIEEALGPALRRQGIDVEPVPIAQASVSAVVPFRFRSGGAGEAGVLKVRKPFVDVHFAEDLALLRELAAQLEARSSSERSGGAAHTAGLEHVRLSAFFRDVCELLERETDFRLEQRSLESAGRRLARLPGARVPALFTPLCSDSVTAMERIDGAKVTALRSAPRSVRQRVATRMVQALLLEPMLSPASESVLYADPHAGNLLWDGARDELVVLDWSLTERLTREERRHIVRWTCAVALRDEALAWEALRALRDRAREAEGVDARARRELRAAFAGLSWIPPLGSMGSMGSSGQGGSGEWIALLDRLARTGLCFSRALVMLRKVVFQLEGVFHSMGAAPALLPALAGYRGPARMPLRWADWNRLAWSGALLPNRNAWRLAQDVWSALAPAAGVATQRA